jgi:copper chaperone CopZ
LGVVAAAIAASACCILPLLLGAAGAGTVGLGAALIPYRPYFIALTVLLLGGAFYFTYRPQKGGCETDCDTKSVRARRISRALLWGVTIFTVGALAYPNIAAYRARPPASSIPAVAASVKVETVLFTIPSIACAACAVNIADALHTTPGVYDAEVDFDTKQASVRYDATRIGVAQLRDAIDRTGFPATQTKPVGDGADVWCPATCRLR